MMPHKTRFNLALVIAAGGIVVSGALVSADAATGHKKPPNGKEQQSRHGLDWERHR